MAAAKSPPMTRTKEFENQIYAEIRGRIKEDDLTAPVRKGNFYYYKRYLQGKEYVQHCRCRVPNTEAPPSVYDTIPNSPEEHVVLDENVQAEEHKYYGIGAFKSPVNMSESLWLE